MIERIVSLQLRERLQLGFYSVDAAFNASSRATLTDTVMRLALANHFVLSLNGKHFVHDNGDATFLCLGSHPGANDSSYFARKADLFLATNGGYEKGYHIFTRQPGHSTFECYSTIEPLGRGGIIEPRKAPDHVSIARIKLSNVFGNFEDGTGVVIVVPKRGVDPHSIPCLTELYAFHIDFNDSSHDVTAAATAEYVFHTRSAHLEASWPSAHSFWDVKERSDIAPPVFMDALSVPVDCRGGLGVRHVRPLSTGERKMTFLHITRVVEAGFARLRGARGVAQTIAIAVTDHDIPDYMEMDGLELDTTPLPGAQISDLATYAQMSENGGSPIRRDLIQKIACVTPLEAYLMALLRTNEKGQ